MENQRKNRSLERTRRRKNAGGLDLAAIGDVGDPNHAKLRKWAKRTFVKLDAEFVDEASLPAWSERLARTLAPRLRSSE